MTTFVHQRSDPIAIFPSDGSRDGGSLLLIEDNPIDASRTMALLRSGALNMSCRHVRTLAEATAQLLAAADCVLLDLDLPDAKGQEGLRQVLNRQAGVAVVVLTGQDDPFRTGLQSIRNGAQDYLTKDSIDATTLERCIRYAIERKGYDDLWAMVAGSGDAIFGATTDGKVTSWNPAAERLFGYSSQEMIGQSVELLAPAGRLDEQAQSRARLNAGGPAERYETQRRCKDGRLVAVLITASPATDETGQVVGHSVIAHDIAQSHAEQAALKDSRRRLAEAQRIAHLGSHELDLVTGEMTWSDEQYRILGLDPARPPSADLFESMVHPDDRAALVRAWKELNERAVPFELVYRIIRGDSEIRWVHNWGIAELDEEGTVVKLAGTLRDNTERIDSERARHAAVARFELGFEQSTLGVAIADLSGIATRVNPAFCTLVGRPRDQLIGRSWIEYAHPDDLTRVDAVPGRVTAGHETYADEGRFLRPDGSVAWASAHVTLVRDEAGEPSYYFAQLQDITDRKQMEQDLAHQSLHDSLTGLPNRALLGDRLIHGLAGSRRRGSHLGVIFLDVDNFKLVNDSLGHAVGDDLLKWAAGRISGAIRAGDTVARVGGDEFVVVCDDISAIEMEQIADRVLGALSRPWQVADQELSVTASLGVAVADAATTPESLLRDSDAAMHRAKERGRGRIEIFDAALRAKAERRLASASELRRAVEREELIVHFQPVVDLRSGAMVSAEALVRWDHPNRGLVPPDEFIPLAEDTGLIVPLGAWVLGEACAQLARWQTTEPSMTVAVNLSVRQLLDPGIADLIKDVLTRTGVKPESLCLELTETVLMDDVDYFGSTLASLKAVGVRLAIDDFGTGYSSLSYLKQFPVDAVKVDRAFVDGLGTDPHDSALVAAIVAMAGALGLEVTAEGVETHDQLISLKQLHCRRAQGYYIARPMTDDAIAGLVARSHRWQVD